MARVTRWDPFRDLLSIQDEMNQLFSRVSGQEPGSDAGTRAWAPVVDISERSDAYVVSVELAGVKPEDVDITLEEGLLSIQGERRFEQETTDRQYHRIERRYGAFRRSITLPSQVKSEQIEASMDGGVLQIVVPKADEAKPRKIEVRPSAGRKPVEGQSSQTGGSEPVGSSSSGSVAASG